MFPCVCLSPPNPNLECGHASHGGWNVIKLRSKHDTVVVEMKSKRGQMQPCRSEELRQYVDCIPLPDCSRLGLPMHVCLHREAIFPLSSGPHCSVSLSSASLPWPRLDCSAALLPRLGLTLLPHCSLVLVSLSASLLFRLGFTITPHCFLAWHSLGRCTCTVRRLRYSRHDRTA